ncbi:MAG TPA: hypothetical protein VFI04_09160 [Gaiellaceae bacterium]|nr:hypothetical protein [Gaiellaceae bacterium]
MELAAPHEQETRDQLARLDDAIETGIQILSDHARDVDPNQIQTLVETAERLALRLDENLPPAMEAANVAEIRGILIGALRKLREAQESEEARPLDVLDDFLVRAESIRHIIRDALDEELPVNARDPKALLTLLQQTLPGLSKKQLAELLGIDPKTLARWDAGTGRVSHRAQLVLRMVLLLRRGWTPEGTFAWFYRVRRDLGGHRAIDLLEEKAINEEALMDSVRAGRAQHAS